LSFTASLPEIVAENFNGLLSAPAHWPRLPLQEFASITNGVPLPSAGFNTSTGTPVVRIRNVRDGATETLFDGPVENSWFIEPGDLLVGMDGDFNAARWKGPRALLNQRVCRVAPVDDRTTVRYLALVLPGYLAAVNKHTPSITVKHLSSRTVGELPIPVPPRPEQDHLVDAIESNFSRLDAAVASLTRAKANVKRARASVLKAAVEGRLVRTEAELARTEGRAYEPASVLLERILAERMAKWVASDAQGKYKEPATPKVEGLPGLPDGWCWASCDQVGDILLGRQRAPQYLTGRFFKPYLRVANVKDDRIDFSSIDEMDFDEGHFEKYRLVPGDILVSEGQSPELVGQSAIFREGPKDFCFQKTLHRFRPLAAGPSAEYAQVVFRAWVRTGVFMRRASITTNIAHLTLEKFKGSPFALPPLMEQVRIVADVGRRLSVLDALDATLAANLARCARLRQSILKRAFEGKLVETPLPGTDSGQDRTGAARAKVKDFSLGQEASYD
jgi:type I restriction enzyme S subunit